MHEESLTQNTKRVLESLSESGVTKSFYLAGGSALALYLGHRFSVDLDWFAEKFSYTPSFRQKLSKLGRLSVDSESEKTFNGALNGVKISFFEYPYPLISAKTKFKPHIFLAGKPDIAAMKLDAIATRGSYKDFIDIYFLLREYSLGKLLGFLRKKFAGIEYNETHLLKSLVYFEDVARSEMPRFIVPLNWQKVTRELDDKVKEYLKSL